MRKRLHDRKPKRLTPEEEQESIDRIKRRLDKRIKQTRRSVQWMNCFLYTAGVILIAIAVVIIVYGLPWLLDLFR